VKGARPLETAPLFQANAAAKPPHCFFSALPKKSGAHGRRTIRAAAAFCLVRKVAEKLKAASAPSVPLRLAARRLLLSPQFSTPRKTPPKQQFG